MIDTMEYFGGALIAMGAIGCILNIYKAGGGANAEWHMLLSMFFAIVILNGVIVLKVW
ncbi:MAG: hypothetical protein NXH79_10570 [Rhodobacteraceae bacterium]|nr:hypothetical protein [Paracoccaceae bacterium]